MAVIDPAVIEGLLHRVQKPARYMGCELNLPERGEVRMRMALSYPDLYEVGMSNNGIRILYDIANSVDGVSCERVFAVERDFEEVLRDSGVPLYTLESLTPLCQLDLLGFNVSHELLATNILQILDLGGIPLLRRERRDGDPIVMAGGEAVSNPLPLFDFIDLFFIGDGEEAIAEIAAAVMEARGQCLPRQGLLASLASIPGTLAPGVQGRGRAVRRVYRGPMRDPARPIVSNMRITQERAVVEIARGCPNLCNFCHAGYNDLPYRAYPHREAADRVLEILANTGYDEVTLSSLSVGDYRALGWLLNEILPGLTERGVTVSLPSLRVDTATLPFIEIISEVRRTSITLAVESGSEEMRRRANKRLSGEHLVAMAKRLRRLGWKVLKLYFMLGLPGCNEHDEAASIIALLLRLLDATERRMDFNVTLSPFVPKPHTPFQRERQMDTDYFRGAVERIKKGLPRRITIKSHDLKASRLEGVLARGDERLGRVILESYRAGCRLDSWSEFVRYEIWERNLEELVPGWESFLERRREGEPLPWEIVDPGYGGLIGRMADRSRRGECMRMRETRYDAAVDAEAVRAARERFSLRYATAARYRIRFARTGMMRFISHMDFVEILKRGLRMAGAPVTFTQGFNKREKIATGHPLPLGFQSLWEIADIELFRPLDENFLDILAGKLPEGICPVEGRYIEKGGTVMAATAAAEFRVDFAEGAPADEAAERLRCGRIRGDEGDAPLPHGAVLRWERPDDLGLLLVLPIAAKGMRADALVRALTGISPVPGADARITRTALLDAALSPIF
ncbi:MAG: DUF2344 domain-containing protein [Spirochaetes bacterium]|nr:DUF2344 domain-containing protein [Spirochaetota bacterium]